ncbi:MAG: DUF262 domain-containing protein [Candidatus Methanoperedens sp.]
MTLQDEINEKVKKIHTDGYPMSIGELISLYRDGELDIHPEFQRIYRWSQHQKSKFIESILLGIPIPSIFVSQREDGVWDVVDGLQRLATIFEFVGNLKDENGIQKPPSSLLKTKYLPSLEGKLWESNENPENALTQPQRISFKRVKIDIKIVKKESDPSIKYELFQRLNTLGSKLSDQEVRNCLLIMIKPDFFNWIRELGEYESFLNCISLADKLIDEQYHLELISRFFIFKNIDVEEYKNREESDLGEFITNKMLEYSDPRNFDRDREMRIFKKTFDLLNYILSDSSFKRYNDTKSIFEGKFLVSAFEAIAIGIGSNIQGWESREFNEALKDEIKNRAKSLWSNQIYRDNSGSGINAGTRIPVIIPLGKNLFRP